jgi:YD repeat-containing protein
LRRRQLLHLPQPDQHQRLRLRQCGEPHGRPGAVMDYDAENRMKTATLGGQTSSYGYDGNGRRVKQVTPAGTRYYYYDVNAVEVR